MQLIKQIIEKKLALSEEYILKKDYNKGIWNFYTCFNLAICLIKYKNTPELRKINNIWKNALFKGVFSESDYQKINLLMNTHRKTIILALQKCDDISKELNYESSNIYEEGCFAISVYEYPELR